MACWLLGHIDTGPSCLPASHPSWLSITQQCVCAACAPPPLQAMERQLSGESGNKLDSYEMEVLNERADVLKDLAEFQLAAVGGTAGTAAALAGLQQQCQQHSLAG